MYSLLLAAALLGQQPNRQDFQVLGSPTPVVQTETEAQRDARLQEEAKEIKIRRELELRRDLDLRREFNLRQEIKLLERERREKQAEVERLPIPMAPTPSVPRKKWLMGVINGRVMWIWGWMTINGQIAWLPNDVPTYPPPASAPQSLQLQMPVQLQVPVLQSPLMLQVQQPIGWFRIQ